MGYTAEQIFPTPTLINAGVFGGILLIFNLTMELIDPEAAPIWSQVIIVVGVLFCQYMEAGLLLAIKYITIARSNVNYAALRLHRTANT